MSGFRIDQLPAYWRRSDGRRLLLLEAVANLAWSRVEIRLVHFRRLAPRLGLLMEETPDVETPGYDRRAREIRSAIRAAAAHLPWESSCLVRALAGMRMLRRRGLSCTLYFGVNREGGTLQAHAWLRCGSLPVTGYEQAPAFARISCIGSFPRHGTQPPENRPAAS